MLRQWEAKGHSGDWHCGKHKLGFPGAAFPGPVQLRGLLEDSQHPGPAFSWLSVKMPRARRCQAAVTSLSRTVPQLKVGPVLADPCPSTKWLSWYLWLVCVPSHFLVLLSSLLGLVLVGCSASSQVPRPCPILVLSLRRANLCRGKAFTNKVGPVSCAQILSEPGRMTF